MFTAVVKGRTFHIIDVDFITTGSVGLEIRFVFDEEWAGLTKTATFKTKKTSISMLISNNRCVIPHEVLEDVTQTLYIGVRGTNGQTLIIPTIWTAYKLHEGTTLGEDTTSPATISVIEQLAAEAYQGDNPLLMQGFLPAKSTRYYADGGAIWAYHQNTVLAYEEALRLPWVEGVFGDVRVTSDGYYVMYQNENLSAKTDSTGVVGEITYAQVHAANVNKGIYDAANNAWVAEPHGRTSKIPTIDEFLDVCKKYGKIAFITPRWGNANADMSNFDAVIAKIYARNMQNSVVFWTTASALSYIHSKYPDIYVIVGITTWTQATIDAYCVKNATVGANMVTIESNTALLDYMHEKGKMMIGYVDKGYSGSYIEKGISLGVDGICIYSLPNEMQISYAYTGATDYDGLTNRPKINGVTLTGNKSGSDLGLDEIVRVTYGDMSSANEMALLDAFSHNKIVVCRYNYYDYVLDHREALEQSGQFKYIFTATDKDGNVRWLEFNNVTPAWTNGSTGAPHSIPSGGTAGQVLKKSSGTNYAVQWADADVFWATYGTTTFAEIISAVGNNRVVACQYSSGNGDTRTYWLKRIEQLSPALTDSIVTFTTIDTDGTIYYLTLNGNTGVWSNGSTGAPHSIPSGGTAGQILKKSSGTNYAVEWADEDSVFWVTYGTTTNSQIAQAMTNNKILICRYNNRDYFYEQKESLDHVGEYIYIFTAADEDGNNYWIKFNNATTTWSNGRSVVKDIFWATYGTTTYSEINDALQDNKILACNYNNLVYIYQKREPLVHYGEFEFIFTAIEEDGNVNWIKYNMSTSAWTNGSISAPIPAPASPSNGQFLMWNGSAWVASSLPTYNGEVS